MKLKIQKLFNNTMWIPAIALVMVCGALFMLYQTQVHHKTSQSSASHPILIIRASEYFGNIHSPAEADAAMIRLEKDKKRWAAAGYIVLDSSAIIAAPKYLYLNDKSINAAPYIPIAKERGFTAPSQ